MNALCSLLPSPSPLLLRLPLRSPNHHQLSSAAAAATVVVSSTSSAVTLSSRRVRRSGSACESRLKEEWIASLASPLPDLAAVADGRKSALECATGEWVLGIDPDASGALALLKSDASSSSFTAEVHDTPHLQVPVGKRTRKRLNTRSIVELLHGFNAPLGTTAYIEQATPFPKDGKLGWWSSGFTYGLWVGILVASGFSVIPVPPNLWKNHFELSGSSCKDDSREAASTLFPLLSSSLKRKKDHGRAEALLIAAYGKGLTAQSRLTAKQELTSPTIQFNCANAVPI